MCMNSPTNSPEPTSVTNGSLLPVKSYDATTGKHALEFLLNDVPVTGICVKLEKCIFQEWTRPDVRALKAKNIL